jgi:hypothetical protein
MRLIGDGPTAIIAALGIFIGSAAARPENSVVVRPEDFTAIEVKDQVVEVIIKGPKAKQLADKDRHTSIQFSVPFRDEKAAFVVESHFTSNAATLLFQFPNKSSAADFAAMLKTAKAKILSQCDCQ